MILRIIVLLYGLTAYVLFLGVYLYAVGFVVGFGTPTALDGIPTHSWQTALAINFGLLSVFAIQHSGMARPTFKKWLLTILPHSVERSTYVLASNLAMILLFALWQPLGGTIWDVQNSAGRIALYCLSAVGWLIVLVTTFLINHFDLFGLRQVWLFFLGRPYTSLPFKTPGPYRWVRHPLYVGWLIAFWATPTMTVAHLVFSIGTTAYILLAIQWEERDLCDALPEYRTYRNHVPMLIPNFRKPTTVPVETNQSTLLPMK